MMTKEDLQELYEIVRRWLDEAPEAFSWVSPLWIWPAEFLSQAPENWTMEEFLQWQRENSPPKHNLGRMVARLERSDEFKQLVTEVREEYGINMQLMRGMTRKECEAWALFRGQPHLYFGRWGSPLTSDIYAILDGYELASPWYRYVLSWVLYGEGSAGFNTLSNATVISYETNPVTREWDLKLEVSTDVVGYEVAKAVSRLVRVMKRDMLAGRDKRRRTGPHPLGAQELWVKLRFDKDKNVDEICRMMKRLHHQADKIEDYYDKTGELLPELDADIKDIYKGRPLEKVVPRLLNIARMDCSRAYLRPYVRKAISRAKRHPPTYEPPDLPPDELERLTPKPPDSF